MRSALCLAARVALALVLCLGDDTAEQLVRHEWRPGLLASLLADGKPAVVRGAPAATELAHWAAVEEHVLARAPAFLDQVKERVTEDYFGVHEDADEDEADVRFTLYQAKRPLASLANLSADYTWRDDVAARELLAPRGGGGVTAAAAASIPPRRRRRHYYFHRSVDSLGPQLAAEATAALELAVAELLRLPAPAPGARLVGARFEGANVWVSTPRAAAALHFDHSHGIVIQASADAPRNETPPLEGVTRDATPA